MELNLILNQFLSSNTYLISPINNGLINTTYKVSSLNKTYVLQKINTQVFKYPENVNQNHVRITNALKLDTYSKQTVKLYNTHNQKLGFTTPNGDYWRLFKYIPNSVTYLKVPNANIAYKAAACFSEFYAIINKQNLKLEPTIPDFLNFEKRINDYKISLNNASIKRLESAKNEIEIINSFIHLPNNWIDLTSKNILPLRVIHADPKISNILFDLHENPIAVIDLDTVMHATILYDFGDMIRSYCNLTNEDDPDLKNNFSLEIYLAVKSGFLSHLSSDLLDIEIQNLDYAAQVVIYIQALRFLTDYLNNDVYYTTNYENHNLNRTKNQLQLRKNFIQKLK